MTNKSDYCKNWHKNHPDYLKEWVANNPEKVKQYRGKRKEAQAAYYRKWYAANGRNRADNYIEMANSWNKLNPEKYRISHQVQYAVRVGKIIKPTHCSECGEERKLNAHHDDYRFPFKIRWLCHSCHKLEHNKVDNEGIEAYA